MTQDDIRVARIRRFLQMNHLDAVVGTLPEDVLMLTGYWPMTGSAIAVATASGKIGVVAPEDEKVLADRSWADPIHTFEPATLKKIETLEQAVQEPFEKLLGDVGIKTGRVGYRRGPYAEPSTYAAMHLYGASLIDLLRHAGVEPVPADDALTQMRAVKSPTEIENLRRACRIAALAFEQGARQIHPGLRETEAAEFFRVPLSTVGVGYEGTHRANGYVYCMAGTDSAQAYGAYARSRANIVEADNLALIHCNSFADGFWTDITRTYHFGSPGPTTRERHEAILAAHAAALALIAPGVRASDVDHAARSVLESRGYGKEFKHATGHGMAYAAFDPNALPRIHPESHDVLEEGMVFNIEPAVYFDGWGGMRHCDVVAVTSTGAELLTDFQPDLDSLILPAN